MNQLHACFFSGAFFGISLSFPFLPTNLVVLAIFLSAVVAVFVFFIVLYCFKLCDRCCLSFDNNVECGCSSFLLNLPVLRVFYGLCLKMLKHMWFKCTFIWCYWKVWFLHWCWLVHFCLISVWDRSLLMLRVLSFWSFQV